MYLFLPVFRGGDLGVLGGLLFGIRGSLYFVGT